MTVHELALGGCTPERLMSYLKALGVLRLVAEQRDPGARGCWRNGMFVLRSSLDREALERFFQEEYRPTPILVPWSGNDFFDVDRRGRCGPFKKTPTATAVIEAFLGSTTERLSRYREGIRAALVALDACGIREKGQLEDKATKSRFLACLRSTLEEQVVEWIDACAVLSDEKASFSSLLGSGGGSDGNTHFSDNFMQNLWEMLPDFDPQRAKRHAAGTLALRGALWGNFDADLVPNRTSSLFDAGAVGGPNAGQGFERVSLASPWGFILCLEGTLLLAGCIVRRHGPNEFAQAAFPFQVRLTPTRLDSASDKESSGREIWMPLWSAWASRSELAALLSEGRASLGGTQARRGVDFARAASALGVDRGIDAFQRHAIVRGRVGGENYNTSASLGRFEVRARADVDLLREADGWLDSFRKAASRDEAPPRFPRALRAIESSIFEYCQHGGPERFGEILCALGRAERELATGEKFRKEGRVCPLADLSPDWIRAGNDDSLEFHLALSLAGIWDREHKVGPLRANLEPVGPRVATNGKGSARWLENHHSLVWSSAALPVNLAAVLERRVMESGRQGCAALPLSSRHPTALGAVAKFLAGEVDDEKISELLWGLVLVDHTRGCPKLALPRTVDPPPLPRAFGLVKLLFLPDAIETARGEAVVKPELSVLALVRAGRVGEACSVAVRRLRARGLVPMPASSAQQATGDADWPDAARSLDPRRLAAALLLPLARDDAKRLARLILRPEAQIANAVG